MSAEVYVAFFIFLTATSISPGPNNFMLMTSGSLFGWRATIPHMIGVEVGFATLLVSVIFGMDLVLQEFPWLMMTVRIVGGAWLIWFGLQFIRSAVGLHRNTTKEPISSAARPLKFHEAFLFQWINPKGLMMATSCAGSFVLLSPNAVMRASAMGLTSLLIGTAACLSWTMMGSGLSALMGSGKNAKWVHLIMGLLFIVMAIGLTFS